MTTNNSFASDGTGWSRRGSRKPAVALGFLYLLNTLLILDKIIFVILLEPIKAEFELSDLQLGLLTGSVYAVFMGAASLPMGLLADRSNRRNLAAFCLMIWSAMTAACGVASTYATLLLARLGVGVGEAGGGPAALSIISDLYGHKRRATAMAIYSLGTPTAALLNLTLFTQIAHSYGWRAALLSAAVPGLLLGLAMWLFMGEPRRTSEGASSNSMKDVKSVPLRETVRFIGSQRSLLLLLSGTALAYVVLAGVSAWNFSYLVRRFEVDLHEIGPYLGVGISCAGLAGLYFSGRIADFLAQRNERWRSTVMALTTLGSVAFGLVTFTTDSLPLAIIGTAGVAACSMLWLGPGLALSQSLVKGRMRGTIGAMMFLLANLIGYGAGPPLVGFLSDLLQANGFANGLQLAILSVLTLNILSALLFYSIGRTLIADLDRVKSIEDLAKRA